METKATIRFVSGREEQFEIELWGGGTADRYLKEFAKDPTIVLQTEDEILIIPSTAIECITIPFPEFGRGEYKLEGVRKAKRLQ